MFRSTQKVILFLLFVPMPVVAQDAPVKRSLVTDEPRRHVGKPEGAPDYVAKTRPGDGQHLALTIQKLTEGIDPPRPFLIWALGSSYTNMLGDGEAWKTEIPKRFPGAPPITYQKMVGNSCPWQYVRGWARHLVVPDQPDLVVIYTLGTAEDLEKLILELRTQTTADIIVPSIHWRTGGAKLWGTSENSTQQDVQAVRDVCSQYDVEFVENRKDWATYLRENDLPIESLLKDAVHQSEFGAQIINSNIIAHVRQPNQFSYDPKSREYIVATTRDDNGTITATFTGNRIDLVGKKSPAGGRLSVRLDGKPADAIDAFLMSYVQPSNDNARVGRGSNPRDQSPHAITLGSDIVPQNWTIVMTSDEGDYRLTGSVTGPDGEGNAFKPFTSDSGQIRIEPELWRRAERNREGDHFQFDVYRSVLAEIDFRGDSTERFVVRVAQALTNESHKLELTPIGTEQTAVEYLKAYRPPVAEKASHR